MMMWQSFETLLGFVAAESQTIRQQDVKQTDACRVVVVRAMSFVVAGRFLVLLPRVTTSVGTA